jgi:hypothetical protein
MTTWLFFWIGAIATYRITVLITRDLGPFGIFKRLRSINEFWKCPFCVSPYVASFIAIAVHLSGDFRFSVVLWILFVFSWSGITIALDRTFTSDYNT